MMQKQMLSTIAIIILLSALPCFQASANSAPPFKTPEWFAGLCDGDSLAFSRTNTISTKKGEKYDESKDPALRRGTENWEQPQGNFWAIPAAVVGVILLILFFNKEN